jgi:hypothetical protein
MAQKSYRCENDPDGGYKRFFDIPSAKLSLGFESRLIGHLGGN